MAAQLSHKLDWQLMNPILASTLNPLIANPLNTVIIIKKITLINGVTIINHKLGKMMSGWFITDIDSPATIYRSASLNTTTLTLTSDASVVVNIGVF